MSNFFDLSKLSEQQLADAISSAILFAVPLWTTTELQEMFDTLLETRPTILEEVVGILTYQPNADSSLLAKLTDFVLEDLSNLAYDHYAVDLEQIVSHPQTDDNTLGHIYSYIKSLKQGGWDNRHIGSVTNRINRRLRGLYVAPPWRGEGGEYARFQ